MEEREELKDIAENTGVNFHSCKTIVRNFLTTGRRDKIPKAACCGRKKMNSSLGSLFGRSVGTPSIMAHSPLDNNLNWSFPNPNLSNQGISSYRTLPLPDAFHITGQKRKMKELEGEGDKEEIKESDENEDTSWFTPKYYQKLIEENIQERQIKRLKLDYSSDGGSMTPPTPHNPTSQTRRSWFGNQYYMKQNELGQP